MQINLKLYHFKTIRTPHRLITSAATPSVEVG